MVHIFFELLPHIIAGAVAVATHHVIDNALPRHLIGAMFAHAGDIAHHNLGFGGCTRLGRGRPPQNKLLVLGLEFAPCHIHRNAKMFAGAGDQLRIIPLVICRLKRHNRPIF